VPAKTDVAEATTPTAEATSYDLQELRRLWPNVIDRVKDYRRVTWTQLFEKSDVIGVDTKQLQVGLRDVGAHKAFTQGGHDEIVRQALIDIVGLDVTVVGILDPSVSGSAPASAVDVGKPGRTPGASTSGEDEAALDDDDADDAGLAGPELIAQQLGGTVIGEIDHP
jgi:DNA polymerase-3 subunit gamma/tau